MIPIRDNVPRVHPPVVVWALIAANTLAFLVELALDERLRLYVFHLLGVVPARFLDPSWARMAGYPDFALWPFVTYMFLHSGLLHLALNMWMLWIFADNIEDVTGHWRFVAFYLLCGVAAAGAYILAEPSATIPVVGASGAIAGVMGAYFRLYPHGRVHTLVPVFFLPLFVDIPAPLFLGVWLALQLISGLGLGGAQSVAWWAHIGGFAAGYLLIPLFRRKDRCYYCYDPERRYYDRTMD